MDARLIVVGGKANKSEVKLKLPTTIGRSRAADLTVAHPKVSRQHCQIFEREGMLVVRDNGSLNGTFIGEARITESVLKPGEKLTVGPLTFVAAYEPARADAGTMPTVDLPTPLFEPPSPASALQAPIDGSSVAPTEGEANDWLDDAPDYLPSDAEPSADLESWLSEPPAEEGALSFDEVVEPPAIAPDADDFRIVNAASESAETVPADSEWPGQPHAADATIDLPPPTVAFESPVPAPQPLSPDDFRLTDDDGGDTASEVPPTITSMHAAGGLADSGEQFSPAMEQEADSGGETFGWSPAAPGAHASENPPETIGAAGFDQTTEVMPDVPPVVIDANDQQHGDESLVEPLAPATTSRGKPGGQPAGRKGWWPFGGKKKAATKGTPSADVVEDGAAEAPSPLPAEAPSLHTGILTPLEEPALEADESEPTIEPPAVVDESADVESDSPATNDEELSEFFKSLGK